MRRKIYFTSDLHIGHENCLKFDDRPFDTLSDMYRTIVKRFNAVVPIHGITYFLGDFEMGDFDAGKDILSRLNGTKVCIKGNHSRGADALYNMGFDVVLEKGQISIGKNIVTMSHCPLKGVFREDVTGMKGAVEGDMWHGESRHGDRYGFEDFGQYHLSGHLHSKPENKILGRQFDVGVVANNYMPVSLSQVESWIAKHKKDNK